jgi:hypothetical protein
LSIEPEDKFFAKRKALEGAIFYETAINNKYGHYK